MKGEGRANYPGSLSSHKAFERRRARESAAAAAAGWIVIRKGRRGAAFTFRELCFEVEPCPSVSDAMPHACLPFSMLSEQSERAA